ncbi:MAG: cytochrome c maturation protein CcmE [Chitinophagaceae bacterium]|nr:cytochrome c maturation protein CcmE [Chitinophagaceae bacterium]MCW5927089.1 cytochrome c maturation protein CcmE [Chitinophagaceae bacterium]
MKKIHIVALVLIAGAIAYMLVTLSSDLTTYDTIASAQQKQGKYLHLIAQLDRTQDISYDPVKDPNYLEFYAIDSLGGKTKVVYHNTKPPELEMSERIVMKGKMNGDVFECKEILLKCPSKYKDDPAHQGKEFENKIQD